MTATKRIRGGVGADEEFWAALEHGEFRISQCGGCGRWQWPAHFRCGTCGSWETVWPAVEPEGTVYTWCRNYAVSDVISERRGDVPYVTLLVELPQAGGVRIPGVLKGDDRLLKIGASLRGILEPASPKSKGYVTMVWELVDTDALPAAGEAK